MELLSIDRTYRELAISLLNENGYEYKPRYHQRRVDRLCAFFDKYPSYVNAICIKESARQTQPPKGYRRKPELVYKIGQENKTKRFLWAALDESKLDKRTVELLNVSKLEKEVKADIKKVLKDLDAWAYMPVPNGYGMKGVPDHIACVPLKITQDLVGDTLGIFVAVEAKRLGKESNAHQTVQLDKIREAHGIAFVVNGTEDEPGNFSLFKSMMYSLFNKLKH